MNHRKDPFADYIEWTQHRYDPGYYLGGRLPPHLRRTSLGRRARRLSAVLLGILATSFIATSLPDVASRGIWWLIGTVAIGALVVAAAVRMYPWKH